MPHRYDIDDAERCLRARWTGRLSAVELEASVGKIEADPAYRTGLNRMFDLREAQVDLPMFELRAIAAVESQLAERNCYRRTAIIVADDLSYGTMRVVASLADLAEASYQIFQNRDAALAWLGTTADEVASGS